MIARYSNAILVGLAALVMLGLGGCASVESSAQYYVAYTTRVYPPKPAEQPIPILGKFPKERYSVIGRLAFETDQGWGYLRNCMVYNAQIHGADAVVLKTVNSRRQTSLYTVPPRVDWYPATDYYRGRHGKVHGYTNWIPYYQPGYTGAYTTDITGMDSEMIVFKK